MLTRNILLIGNGFDLMHDLPTKYEHFYKIMSAIYSNSMTKECLTKQILDGSLWGYKKDDRFSNVISIAQSNNASEIQHMFELLVSNMWVKYYCNVSYESKGWVDFEQDIYPVLNFFKRVFYEYPCFFAGNDYNIQIRNSDFHIANLWNGLFWKINMPLSQVELAKLNGDWIFKIKPDYYDKIQGINKEKIILKLQNDFINFEEAFRIYIKEIVSNIKVSLIDFISGLKCIDCILNFNYTNTEENYQNLQNAQRFHVHGTKDKENQVIMGIDDFPGRDFDFFLKRIQCLHNRIDLNYKREYNSTYDRLYIIGHSLDCTDSSILRDLIQNARVVQIFYYNDGDHFKKISNLKELIRLPELEKRIANNTLLLSTIPQSIE